MATEVQLGTPARCRTCKAAIVFARTLGGRVGPFEKREDGDHVIDKDGLATKYVAPTPQLALLGEAKATTPIGAPRYTSHFSSCPDANEHRKLGPRSHT